MSGTTYGYRGLEAVEKKDWAAAVPLLNQALEYSSSPAWLLARATAHYQLKNYDKALRDAELAYHVAAERGSGDSRRQMMDAQYRRAVVLFKLGRYADSDCCAKWSMLLAEGRPASQDDDTARQVDEHGNYTVTYKEGMAYNLKNYDRGMQIASRAQTSGHATSSKPDYVAEFNRGYAWRSQVLGLLDKLPQDHPGRKVGVTKVPPRPQVEKKAEETAKPEPDSDGEDEAPKPAPAKPTPAPGSVPDQKMKTRIDFYQNNKDVTVSLFVKDVKKDHLKVEFFTKHVRISPILREAAPYVKPGDREATSTLVLENAIVPSNARWSATSRKIELVLPKATPGLKWMTWGDEKIGSVDVEPASGEQPQVTAEPSVPNKPTAPETAKATAPAYPTSSKSGPKNWDRLDDDDVDEDKQDVNYFFKKLFQNATPEQQRAMMKSFTESNGTALSTDWNDVKGRKVETVPPEGVEAKKWNS